LNSRQDVDNHVSYDLQIEAYWSRRTVRSKITGYSQLRLDQTQQYVLYTSVQYYSFLIFHKVKEKVKGGPTKLL